MRALAFVVLLLLAGCAESPGPSVSEALVSEDQESVTTNLVIYEVFVFGA